MTLTASPWSARSSWSPGRWWRTRRVERTVRAFTSAPTHPMPVLTDVVHRVTASWSATAGWTLRFGPSGPAATVRRLTEAEAHARALVAAVLGVSPASLRVRIVPDDRAVETAVALRRGARRPVSRRGAREV